MESYLEKLVMTIIRWQEMAVPIARWIQGIIATSLPIQQALLYAFSWAHLLFLIYMLSISQVQTKLKFTFNCIH